MAGIGGARPDRARIDRYDAGADRLLHENVLANPDFADTTVDPWNACEPLGAARCASCHKHTANKIPADAHGLSVPPLA